MSIEGPEWCLLNGEPVISLGSSSRLADGTPVELILSVPPDLGLSILERLNTLDIRCLLDGCSIDPRSEATYRVKSTDGDGGGFDQAVFRSLSQGNVVRVVIIVYLVSVLMDFVSYQRVSSPMDLSYVVSGSSRYVKRVSWKAEVIDYWCNDRKMC